MISNQQLKNLMGAELKNCTEDELSSIRELLTALASIEHEIYCQNKNKNNAVSSNKRLDISQENTPKLAA
ncbi:MAG: hypothetical protein FJY17_03465 [Bacteroidetes bacterium]|nr:hypothetical protein [Bacteroidota bacterium]